jgi:hypothetical protein
LDIASIINVLPYNWDTILVLLELSMLTLGAAFEQAGPPPSKRSLYARQNDGSGDFSLPPSARNGLSNILVVHVIAAALTLLALILCIIAHVRSPSHSARFLLSIFIIMILTTVLTLLSFLVDLLVFVPHFAFGTWLVLAATVINAIATSMSLVEIANQFFYVVGDEH